MKISTLRFIRHSGLALVLVLISPFATGSNPIDTLLITDFSQSSDDLAWFIVNDTVMGGRSSGQIEQRDNVLFFSGTTNTNGGGFSSIRTRPLELMLSEYSGIQLKVKGDGRRYTWRISTDARWRGRLVSYWADFDTVKGKWSTVKIPFSQFKPQFRGYQLDGPELDSNRISRMGLMIYDKQDGVFELELSSVQAYQENLITTLKNLQWKNRVVLISAPTKTSSDLRTQLDSINASSKDFDERDMVLITLTDQSMQATELRQKLNIDVDTFTLKLIGKDGSVKLTQHQATPMAEIYGLIDGMPMRQREMKKY